MTKNNVSKQLTRWIPKDSTAVEHALGVVYAYRTARNVPAAIGYAGKAGKASFHNSFIGPAADESRDKRIQEFFSGLEAHQAMKAQIAADRKTPHTLKIGDVIVNTWGWEQTNQDFYEVVKVTGFFVWLRRLQQETEETGFMCGNTKPLPGQYSTQNPEITQHSARLCRNGSEFSNYVNFEFGCGHKWDGKPERNSWYA